MDLVTIAVEAGIAVSGAVAAVVATSYRVGSKVSTLETKLNALEKEHNKHVEIDERHHREEQDQWQENNRALGRIEGALEQWSNSPRPSRNKSRP